MPLDYRSQIEAAAWALLEADAPFAAAFRIGNRIKLSGDGWLREHMKGSPADYPQIKIEPRGTPRIEPPPRVYGAAPYMAAVADAATIINQQLAIIITYPAEGLRIASELPLLESLIEKWLWAKWPTYGLSYVTQATWTMTRRDARIKNNVHPETTFLISFSLMPMLSQLTA